MFGNVVLIGIGNLLSFTLSSNIIIATLVAGLSMGTIFKLLSSQEQNKGALGLLLFWGLWWLEILCIYVLFKDSQLLESSPWIILCFDAVGGAFIVAAAYAAHKWDNFSWRDPVLGEIFIVALIMILLTFLGGYFVKSESMLWKLFAISPALVSSVFAFASLGLAAGSRFSDFRIPIFITFGIYSLLQVPAYILFFCSQQPINVLDKEYIALCLAAGKLIFFITNMLILYCIAGREKSEKVQVAVGHVLVTLNFLATLCLVVLKVFGTFEHGNN